MSGQNTSETDAAPIPLSHDYRLGYFRDGDRGHAILPSGWRSWGSLCGLYGLSQRLGAIFDPNHPKACKRCVVSAQRRER